jgi:zinc transporter ZupT
MALFAASLDGVPVSDRKRLRSWLIAALTAFAGWLLALVLAIVGMPFGWALLAGGLIALALVTVYAQAKEPRPSEVFAFAFACIMLEWPVLLLLTLLVSIWVGGPPTD